MTEQESILAALRGEGAFPRTELGDAINNLLGRAEAAEFALRTARQECRTLRAAIRRHIGSGHDQFRELRQALGE